MVTPATAAKLFVAPVCGRRTLCREHFEITLRLPSFPETAPGQFVNILCRDPGAIADDGTGGAMMRRPFSIGGLHCVNDGVEIDIMGRVVGPGTAWLDALRVGDEVSLLGPLGRGFTRPAQGERALLIAGGVGLPPIRWLGEILRKTSVSCECIHGAQTRDLLPISLREEPSHDGAFTLCVEEFARDGIAASITTDDGSCGLRGRVTDSLARRLASESSPSSLRVFACGPEPMLRAVARACAERGLHCETAMERVMGCGMGTCQSCVVEVKDSGRAEGRRYALCCRDGPVFDAATVCW
ncbi:MAG: dihydroorotate dehydrogenase electron transfer subunit [Planctomycetota bacterium]